MKGKKLETNGDEKLSITLSDKELIDHFSVTHEELQYFKTIAAGKDLQGKFLSKTDQTIGIIDLLRLNKIKATLLRLRERTIEHLDGHLKSIDSYSDHYFEFDDEAFLARAAKCMHKKFIDPHL